MAKPLNIVYIGAAGDNINSPINIFYVFDPRTESIKHLENKHNVKHYTHGLSSTEGTVKLYKTKKGSCSSTYEPNLKLIEEIAPKRVKDFTPEKIFDIEVKRLDSIIPTGTKIELMKIDTQGSELDILKGAGQLLKTTRKIVVEVEFKELYLNQPLFEDVDSFLVSKGFKFDKYNRRVRWENGGFVFADAVYINKTL